MKGKLLTYEEIIKLPHGTKVWVDDTISKEFGFVNQDRKWVRVEHSIDNNGWDFTSLKDEDYVDENDIKIYEIEEDKSMKVIGHARFQKSTEGMTKEQMLKFIEDSSDCPKAFGLKDSEGCDVSCDLCARQAIKNAEGEEQVAMEEITKEIKVEEIEDIKPKQVSENWFGKKYKITYFKGSTYRMAFDSSVKGKFEIASILGTLINIDAPFTGRFFIENLNGALEIVLMESVVEMREIVE